MTTLHFETNALHGHLIQETTMEELSLGQPKGGHGHFMEVAV